MVSLQLNKKFRESGKQLLLECGLECTELILFFSRDETPCCLMGGVYYLPDDRG
jgi:hypothetical protein